MMSKDEFIAKFRGQMLLHLTEAWACRSDAPSALGLTIDAHAGQIKRLLGEMYDALQPKPNGTPPQTQRKA